MSPNLLNRILVAAVAIPAALAIVYIGGWALVAAIAVLGVAGTREVYALAEASGLKPVYTVGYVGSAAAPVCVFLASPGGLGFDPLLVCLLGGIWLMVVMLVTARTRSLGDKPLACTAVTVFGVAYAGCLLAALVLLRHPAIPLTSWAATWLVFLTLAVVWVCDTLAMAGGTLIGGAKLTPLLSPNKTWAGAIAGTLGGTVIAPVYGALLLKPNGVSLPLWQYLLLGALISVVGQTGDIAESMFKREVGVKDSGSFFGSHGGVLDRLDSLYWAIPSAVVAFSTFGVI